MANWKSKLDLSDIWEQYDNDELSIQNVSKMVAERLRACRYKNDKDVVDIIERFESLADESSADNIDDFDDVLADLYEFGNIDHRLWVQTC